MTHSELIQNLAQTIQQQSVNKNVFVVAILGPDAAGKTQLTNTLLTELQQQQKNVINIAADWFHYPKTERRAFPGTPPEQFLYHTINFSRLEQEILKPLLEEKQTLRFEHFNVDTDTSKKETITITHPVIVLLEGIFLFQPTLVPYFNFKLYLQVDAETTIQRAITRDAYRLGDATAVRERYETKYVAGQKLYRDTYNPLQYADLVVNNNDWEKPKIIKITT